MKSLILSIVLLILLLVTPCFAEYRYQGTVVSLYDADTFTVEYDVWPAMKITESSRLNGLDTPELRGAKNNCEQEHGYKAKDFTKELILGKTFEVILHKREKFGRPLVDLILPDGKTLTDLLIEKGFAYDYHGEKKRNWFPKCPNLTPLLSK